MYMWVNAWLFLHFKVSCSLLGTILWRYIFLIFSVQDVSHIFSILTRWKIICHTSNGQKGMCICLNTKWNKSKPIIIELIYLSKFWLKHNPLPPLFTPIKPMFFLWGIWSWIVELKINLNLVSPKAIFPLYTLWLQDVLFTRIILSYFVSKGKSVQIFNWEENTGIWRVTASLYRDATGN